MDCIFLKNCYFLHDGSQGIFKKTINGTRPLIRWHSYPQPNHVIKDCIKATPNSKYLLLNQENKTLTVLRTTLKGGSKPTISAPSKRLFISHQALGNNKIVALTKASIEVHCFDPGNLKWLFHQSFKLRTKSKHEAISLDVCPKNSLILLGLKSRNSIASEIKMFEFKHKNMFERASLNLIDQNLSAFSELSVAGYFGNHLVALAFSNRPESFWFGDMDQTGTGPSGSFLLVFDYNTQTGVLGEVKRLKTVVDYGRMVRVVKGSREESGGGFVGGFMQEKLLYSFDGKRGFDQIKFGLNLDWLEKARSRCMSSACCNSCVLL